MSRKGLTAQEPKLRRGCGRRQRQTEQAGDQRAPAANLGREV